jgi:hypothetical protein
MYREKIDGTAALRSRNVATIRYFAQMVIGSLLALFLRCPKTFSLRAKLISSASMVGAWAMRQTTRGLKMRAAGIFNYRWCRNIDTIRYFDTTSLPPIGDMQSAFAP